MRDDKCGHRKIVTHPLIIRFVTTPCEKSKRNRHYRRHESMKQICNGSASAGCSGKGSDHGVALLVGLRLRLLPPAASGWLSHG
jgi:hypothetical protein